ncbi:MAG: hypothetical protein ABIK31_00375 [candidate division WOR-3 bacterium]
MSDLVQKIRVIFYHINFYLRIILFVVILFLGIVFLNRLSGGRFFYFMRNLFDRFFSRSLNNSFNGKFSGSNSDDMAYIKSDKVSKVKMVRDDSNYMKYSDDIVDRLSRFLEKYDSKGR